MKILHIDDNEKITTSFSKILNMHGYDCTTASDGITGLRFFNLVYVYFKQYFEIQKNSKINYESGFLGIFSKHHGILKSDLPI